jgi:hypothetical protein
MKRLCPLIVTKKNENCHMLNIIFGLKKLEVFSGEG